MNAFEWATPGTVDEAVKLLTEVQADDSYEAARPMAGGQDLLTAMKDHILRPPRVVNLKTIPGLDQVAGDATTGLKIGPLVKLCDIESHPIITQSFPGLAEAAHSIASVQLRNHATIGGNLCQRPRCWYFRLGHVTCLKKGGDTCYAEHGENKYHAIFGGGPSFIVHPSDTATMLVALGGEVTITGPSGKRDVPLAQFFTLPANADTEKENVLQDGELITEIRVPASAMAARSTYLKFKERLSLDFAMAAVAAAVDLDADGRVRQASLVLGGVAPTPWPVPRAVQALVGKKLDDATISNVADIALEGAKPLAKNAYKIPLTKALVRRALGTLAKA
jgi:xanthine dehydrogenase YagS FAD-binding subunit